MKHYFGNSKGAALVYVLIIFAILTLLGTVIYSLLTNNQTQETRVYHQKMVTSLAVSGMQTYVQHPETLIEHYDWQKINLPDGSTIDYYQFAVDESGAKLLPTALIGTNKYKVKVAAIYGDNNQNKIKDDGEDLFIKKELEFDYKKGDSILRTDKPKLRSSTFETNQIFINGTAEPGATIKIYLAQGSFVEGKADNKGNFSIPITGDMNSLPIEVQITATLSPKLESEKVIYRIDSWGGSGIVLIIDKIGTADEYEYYQTIRPEIIKNEDKVVVLTGTDFDAGDTPIFIQAAKQIEIQDNVTLTSGGDISFETTSGIFVHPNATITLKHGGQGNLTFTTTDGDITIVNNSDISNSSNSKDPRSILLNATNGKINIDGTTLAADRGIYLYGKNGISANGSTLHALQTKNEEITLEIKNGEIWIQNFTASNPVTILPISAKVCGRPTSGTTFNGAPVVEFNCPKPNTKG
ncbi:Ig-like domain-containing protein [Bacillus timonensis]|uniref:Ig-like domain-containing protein n=1 Tax=Bacillus timonensis TaxID=1033734 RepID=UPI0011DCA4BF|nr:Ig-like domain-containing protein [Bacillus timonensis]